MSERPKKVFVSPHWFEISDDDKLADVAQVAGVCLEDDQKIVMSTSLAKSVERETVLHECGHAIWHQTELDRGFSDEQEESVMWSFMPRLLALLRDNPKLVEFLLAR